MTLLKQYETDFGIIRVIRSKTDGTLSYYQNGSFHSQATKNGISICAYVHVIHEIIRQAHARNILIIGCAGGTLATMLRHLNFKVTVVDINAMAFAIARRYFKLPEDVRCIRKDGIAYITTTKKHYDAVVIDVFGSNNIVPPQFTTPSFFQSVENILSPKGIMIMNVITKNDKDIRSDLIGCHADTTDMDITLFDWPGQKDRNTLIVGGAIERIHIPSGKEPRWIKVDLKHIVRRKPRRHKFI